MTDPVSFAVSTTAFLGHVGLIVGIGADPQVIGVHAPTDVTSVQYVEAFGDRPDEVGVCPAMGSAFFTGRCAKSSISVSEASSCPQPATIRVFFDLAHKAADSRLIHLSNGIP